MTNSFNKTKRSIAIVAMLLCVSLVNLSTTNWEGIRSVDMVKLMTFGVLLGALATLAIGYLRKEKT